MTEEDFTQTDITEYIIPEEKNSISVLQPFDFKIKELKRYLKVGGMDKHKINATVKLYKQKVYDRVAEVKAKMEKELEDRLSGLAKEDDNASN